MRAAGYRRALVPTSPSPDVGRRYQHGTQEPNTQQPAAAAAAAVGGPGTGKVRGSCPQRHLMSDESFSIRFTDGTPDLRDLWIGSSETVREVQRRIRSLRPSLASRRLRLVSPQSPLLCSRRWH